MQYLKKSYNFEMWSLMSKTKQRLLKYHNKITNIVIFSSKMHWKLKEIFVNWLNQAQNNLKQIEFLDSAPCNILHTQYLWSVSRLSQHQPTLGVIQCLLLCTSKCISSRISCNASPLSRCSFCISVSHKNKCGYYTWQWVYKM